MADGYPNADTYAHMDAYSCSYAQFDPDLDADMDANTHSHARFYSHALPYLDADTDVDLGAGRDAGAAGTHGDP